MSIIRFPTRELNKKKIIICAIIGSLLLILAILSIIYAFNSSFRGFVDIYIFRKEIESDHLPSIEVASDEDQFFYSYDKYIAVLSKNILYTYHSSGQSVAENDIRISSPIFSSNNKFLAIAENGGNNLYLLSGTTILWQGTVEGNISKINVNKNGYVSVILSGTSRKSVVVSFDAKGNELFKTYLSSNLAIDSDISNDNKYLSIAEIDYSGSIIKSMVKNISIEKAKTDPTNSVIYNYTLEDNTLLTSIKYQDRDNLVCMCNDGVYLLNVADLSDKKLIDLDDYEFVDIHLKNHLVYTSNKTFGFSNTSIVQILNTQNNSTSTYELKGSIKSIYSNGEKIAINTGSEIHFIGLNGWLIKKYNSYNEINNILLGDTVAGIISKDKIQIIEI